MADYISAHQFCTNNRKHLEQSTVCGCFYCRRIFDPNEIKEWIHEKSGTAICPYCEIDSVIGDKSGFPITGKLLKEMNQYWFG